jgi:hypothetical protein
VVNLTKSERLLGLFKRIIGNHFDAMNCILVEADIPSDWIKETRELDLSGVELERYLDNPPQTVFVREPRIDFPMLKLIDVFRRLAPFNYKLVINDLIYHESSSIGPIFHYTIFREPCPADMKSYGIGPLSIKKKRLVLDGLEHKIKTRLSNHSDNFVSGEVSDSAIVEQFSVDFTINHIDIHNWEGTRVPFWENIALEKSLMELEDFLEQQAHPIQYRVSMDDIIRKPSCAWQVEYSIAYERQSAEQKEEIRKARKANFTRLVSKKFLSFMKRQLEQVGGQCYVQDVDDEWDQMTDVVDLSAIDLSDFDEFSTNINLRSTHFLSALSDILVEMTNGNAIHYKIVVTNVVFEPSEQMAIHYELYSKSELTIREKHRHFPHLPKPQHKLYLMWALRDLAITTANILDCDCLYNKTVENWDSIEGEIEIPSFKIDNFYQEKRDPLSLFFESPHIQSGIYQLSTAIQQINSGKINLRSDDLVAIESDRYIYKYTLSYRSENDEQYHHCKLPVPPKTLQGQNTFKTSQIPH